MEYYNSDEWRKLSHEDLIDQLLQLKEKYTTVVEEFEEYKASSIEMEQLLEKEAEDAKKEKRALSNTLHSKNVEHERAMNKHDAEKREWMKIEDSLRKENNSLRSEKDVCRQRLRELEQRNDDLERHERNNQQMLEDFEKKMNEAIERTTLLENELADKQTAAEEIFRLREEFKSERPRLIVGPLRVEKIEDTPEEPSPETKMSSSSFMRISSSSTSASPPYSDPQLTPSSPRPDGKGFAGCVNRIVKDLMVKVDRLEVILSGLRTNQVET